MQHLADSVHWAHALLSRAAHGVQDLVRRFTAAIGVQASRSATAIEAAARRTTQWAQNQILLFPLRARSHFRYRRVFYLRLGASLVVAITLFACWAGMRSWHIATRYCAGLSPPIFEQAAVALGASVSGLLAIVFALTIFAIQQVAAREAAEVVLEYASDRRIASTYWVLAAIATTYFALAFVHPPQDFLPTELISFGVLLLLTFLLIYHHFKLMMLYSDPRFTVDRLHQRGMRELRTVARAVNRVKCAMNGSQTHEPE